jgi:hypothetical protein
MNYTPIIHLTPGLRRYADHHIETGSFLRAVLENDLYRAVARADIEMHPYFALLVFYVLAEMPQECWGSKEAVSAWLAARQPTTEANP